MTILEYIEALNRQFKTGLSTEHSYRPLLQGLLAELLPGVEVTNEPQRIDCGAPDFILTRKGVPVGYIEAKDIGKPLDGRQFREQFERYRTSLRNLIITDYLEFRLFRDGEHVSTLSLAEIRDGKVVARAGNIDGFAELIREFGNYEGQTIRSASKLSKMMAAKARLLASIIDGVPQSAWEFYIGGYQPAQKWLKDRKGRTLTYDAVKHYQRIIIALTETERIMGEIDAVLFIL
ncbi:MAG: hypothetical protein HGB06_08670 [Chlorobaculum sp.]|jgi:hypothetical protein|nr:hypothetical protein [Chlorobaculum sp.]